MAVTRAKTELFLSRDDAQRKQQQQEYDGQDDHRHKFPMLMRVGTAARAENCEHPNRLSALIANTGSRDAF